MMPEQKNLYAELYGHDNKHGKISLTGIVPYSNDTDCDNVKYPASNEEYREKTMDIVKSLANLDSYLGVCGGGTQNIMLISMLLEKNMINQFHLVDTSIQQLHNFHKIASIYNDSKTDKDYWNALSRHILEYKKSLTDYMNYGTDCNFSRPSIPIDINMDLECIDIEECVSKTSRPGKYFIYLSNLLLSELFGDANSYNLLENIVSNKSFEDGSVVFMVDIESRNALILEKTKGKLLPPDSIVTHEPFYNILVHFADNRYKKIFAPDDDMLTIPKR